MMAGDVSVSFSPSDANDLVIEGDEQGNQIQITSVGDDRVRITGLNGTTVNDQPFVEETVGDDIRIDMLAGNDEVRVHDLDLDGTSHADLTIKLGADHDFASVESSKVTDDLRIYGSTGADEVLVDNVIIDDDLAIELNGLGDRPRVNLQTATVRDAVVGDDLRIIGGSGIDHIDLVDCVVNDNIDVDTAGDQDRITITGSEADDLYAKSGADKDQVLLMNNDVVDHFFADLGTSDDTLHVEGNDAGRPEFIGGTGFDTLSINWWNPNNFWAYSFWDE